MIFNLLIVDDEAPIRKGLSEYIKWEDYDCKDCCHCQQR